MKRRSALTAPFLKRLSLMEEKVDADLFPFNRLDFLSRPGFSLEFSRRITFFVGENGTVAVVSGIAYLVESKTSAFTVLNGRDALFVSVGWSCLFGTLSSLEHVLFV